MRKVSAAFHLEYIQFFSVGVLMWRGAQPIEFMNHRQIFGNRDDKGKGKQMPIHYGSSDLNIGTVSSPLMTQGKAKCKSSF